MENNVPDTSELVGTAQAKVVTDIYGSPNELSAELAQLSRQAAAEGIVLLKNEATLPLQPTTNVAVFGRVAIDYFYVGNGSGGEVIAPYKINLMEGLKAAGISVNQSLYQTYSDWCAAHPEADATTYDWGKWPTNHPEMALTPQMVSDAKATSDTAIVVLGRCAGEDRDSVLQPGSFYLTDIELDMLEQVTSTFEKIVVIINSGNIIDFSWYAKYENKISTMLYAWQGGQESGHALADVLSGKVNPSGKLPVTIAAQYEDYPTAKNFGAKAYNNYDEDIFVGYRYFHTFAKDKILFDFGYGLSYTNFKLEKGLFKELGNEVVLGHELSNTGDLAGKTVVQYYYSAPQGKLGKPKMQLLGFRKSELLAPGQSAKKSFSFDIRHMKSFDDSGVTGHKNAYVLEAGDYQIWACTGLGDGVQLGTVTLDTLQVVEQLEEVAAPITDIQRWVATTDADGNIVRSTELAPKRTVNLAERITANLPAELTPTGDMGHTLADVKDGNISLEAFVAQLSIEDLEALTHGDFIMNSPLGALGNAGVYGGITQSLRDKGVIPITNTDGPSGIRLRYFCSLMPCGMNLAASWDLPLVNKLMTLHGQELAMRGSHVLLAPGMNIIRDPLCGRNFEYFSEDPYLSGRMGAAVTNGIQKSGRSACPKHFVANNQEAHRIWNDSRMSQRALREIYLRGFEIAVKEANPHNIMTSYNLINGVYGHYHYELCTHVLRGEWGYQGLIVTDWWMRYSQDPDFADITGDAYRVRAQVDVLMPGGVTPTDTAGDGSLMASYNKPNGITLGEIQRSALNTLRFALSQL